MADLIALGAFLAALAGVLNLIASGYTAPLLRLMGSTVAGVICGAFLHPSAELGPQQLVLFGAVGYVGADLFAALAGGADPYTQEGR